VSLGWLDDENYPAVTMGQAAELLGVAQAFLRSLDDTDGMSPARTAGGHRRYSRAQLERAGRMRALFDEGLTLDAVQRIIVLQDQLAAAQHLIAELEASDRDVRAPRCGEAADTSGTDPPEPPTLGASAPAPAVDLDTSIDPNRPAQPPDRNADGPDSVTAGQV
jgi:DNA-binding transcriptional MerR regulator